MRSTHLANLVITTTAPKPDIVALPPSIVAKGVFPIVTTNLDVTHRILAQVVVGTLSLHPTESRLLIPRSKTEFQSSNKFGFCGLGPDYCGKDVCVVGCESKAYCDPGYGAEWAEKAHCPLNVCCSKYVGLDAHETQHLRTMLIRVDRAFVGSLKNS
jgi:hypothetical protein